MLVKCAATAIQAPSSSQMTSTPTPRPPTIPFSDMDDVSALNPFYFMSNDVNVQYTYRESSIRSIACICTAILSAPAFLVRHASIAASLYSTLTSLKNSPLPAEEGIDTELELRTYHYTRLLIELMVPAAVSDRIMQPLEFLNEFTRHVRRIKERDSYIRRHYDATQRREAYKPCYIYVNREFHTIQNTYRYDFDRAGDKAVAALTSHIKFVLAHMHVIGPLTPYNSLCMMSIIFADLYGFLERNRRVSKYVLDMFSVLRLSTSIWEINKIVNDDAAASSATTSSAADAPIDTPAPTVSAPADPPVLQRAPAVVEAESRPCQCPACIVRRNEQAAPQRIS